jgi:hypothetical protein
MEEDQPSHPFDAAILDMAKSGHLWLDDTGTLCTLGEEENNLEPGALIQDMAAVCQDMNIVDALTTAIRMANTVHVSSSHWHVTSTLKAFIATKRKRYIRPNKLPRSLGHFQP